MKKIASTLLIIVLAACHEKPVVLPQGGLGEHAPASSKERAADLYRLERQQIQQWISLQGEKFYPTAAGYWSSEPLSTHPIKSDGDPVSYEFSVSDFDQAPIYSQPIVVTDGKLGSYAEIMAVDHAIRHLESHKTVTLLVPSALAYGTAGDEKKIGPDLPLIIHLNTR
ncbi:MAG: hypothetical protein EAS48_10100 [Chryseobacterium sp.]|nr:MAG: hypothetical protein EAS48_10100 [Chryseobacterium sp.]